METRHEHYVGKITVVLFEDNDTGVVRWNIQGTNRYGWNADMRSAITASTLLAREVA